MALHYQFQGKLAARHLDAQASLKYYKKAEETFLRCNDGNYSLIMQSFFQFIVDDLSELGLIEESLKYNKLYKRTLKANYSQDSIFYIAYTIDIVA